MSFVSRVVGRRTGVARTLFSAEFDMLVQHPSESRRLRRMPKANRVRATWVWV